MILPHDADKNPPPEDSKAFGVFVIFVMIAVSLFVRCSS
jgi:hypothetical protein